MRKLRGARRDAVAAAEEAAAAARAASFATVGAAVAAALDAALDGVALTLGEEVARSGGVAGVECGAVELDALETAHARAVTAVEELVGGCADKLVARARTLRGAESFGERVDARAAEVVDALVEELTVSVHGERSTSGAATVAALAALRGVLDAALAAAVASARREGSDELRSAARDAGRAATEATRAALGVAADAREAELEKETTDLVNALEAGARAQAEAALATLLRRRADARAAAEAAEAANADALAAAVDQALREAREARHGALSDAEAKLGAREVALLRAARAEATSAITADIGQGGALDGALDAALAARAARPAALVAAQAPGFDALRVFASDAAQESDAARAATIAAAAARAAEVRGLAQAEVQHWDATSETRVLERMSAAWLNAGQLCVASVAQLRSTVAAQAATMQSECVGAVVATCAAEDDALAAQLERLIAEAGAAEASTIAARVDEAARGEAAEVQISFGGVGALIRASSQAIVDAAAAPLLSGASAERAAVVGAAFAAAKATLEAEAAAETERDEEGPFFISFLLLFCLSFFCLLIFLSLATKQRRARTSCSSARTPTRSSRRSSSARSTRRGGAPRRSATPSTARSSARRGAASPRALATRSRRRASPRPRAAPRRPGRRGAAAATARAAAGPALIWRPSTSKRVTSRTRRRFARARRSRPRFSPPSSKAAMRRCMSGRSACSRRSAGACAAQQRRRPIAFVCSLRSMLSLALPLTLSSTRSSHGTVVGRLLEGQIEALQTIEADVVAARGAAYDASATQEATDDAVALDAFAEQVRCSCVFCLLPVLFVYSFCLFFCLRSNSFIYSLFFCLLILLDAFAEQLVAEARKTLWGEKKRADEQVLRAPSEGEGSTVEAPI